MNILVLGGTGAIGAHLTKILADRGDKVTVTTRQKRVSSNGINYVQGDAHNISFVKNILLSKWDAIVDFMIYTTPSFKERVDVLLGATKQYVFLSSARVYADSEESIIETSPRLLDVSIDDDFLATDEYSLTKARQEDILQKSGQSNWTIIRPYITYSESRLQLGVLELEEWLYRAIHGRTIVFSKDLYDKQTSLTNGIDVANAIKAVLGNEAAMGEAFHITANPITWKEVLDIYLKVLNAHLGSDVKVKLLELDDFVAYYPAKHQIYYDRMYNRSFDNSKIGEFVDVGDFEKAKIGLQVCLEEFLKTPHFKNVSWIREAKKDKITKEYTRLNEIDGFKNKYVYLKSRYLN